MGCWRLPMGSAKTGWIVAVHRHDVIDVPLTDIGTNDGDAGVGGHGHCQ